MNSVYIRSVEALLGRNTGEVIAYLVGKGATWNESR